ncbi:MAG TPA: sensor histidine kinase [Gaiellaceae bacterium]|nr:sensor histidine kinase [Gaiellaceae bacterium]
MAVRPPHLVAGAAGAGAAVTLAAAFWLPSADARPSLHVAIEAGAGLAALLGAYLLLGRFARTGRVTDVALGAAFAMFGTANVAFAAVPTIVSAESRGTFQLAAIVVFAVASAGFARRAAQTPDELTRWLAPASALAAFAALNYYLFPSVESARVSLGDALSVGFSLLVLVAVARETGASRREHAARAVLEERRRIARELHDGLAQELAFIAVRSRALADGTPGEPLREIASAAGRALDEARLAVSALTRPGPEPLEFALADAAEEVAHRAGAAVELDLAPGIAVLPDQRDALVRITREAIANAVRHGHAEKVEVRLTNGAGIHLAIVDGGLGFDVAETERQALGFGLTSMKERARAIGGELSVSSAPGDGTRVEVSLR